MAAATKTRKAKVIKGSAKKTTKAPKASAGRGLSFPGVKVGAKLSREYKGKTYQVLVKKDGFSFKGKTYDSLTAIARSITGVKMLSGPGFFGVK